MKYLATIYGMPGSTSSVDVDEPTAYQAMHKALDVLLQPGEGQTYTPVYMDGTKYDIWLTEGDELRPTGFWLDLRPTGVPTP